MAVITSRAAFCHPGVNFEFREVNPVREFLHPSTIKFFTRPVVNQEFICDETTMNIDEIKPPESIGSRVEPNESLTRKAVNKEFSKVRKCH